MRENPGVHLRKPAPQPSMGGDLRGAARLAVEAVAGLADLVETLHAAIARLPGSDLRSSGRTGGISARVYTAAHRLTRVVGDTVDAALARLEPLLSERSTRPGYEALLAALNGVMGDWLEERSNPLAIRMCLRSDGVELELEPRALAAALPNARGRVVVLLHGLCMGDLQWARNGADFGTWLARDLGATAIYLRYNSGRHVSTNGHDFAALMELLVQALPVPLESIDIVAHSMGGLVARSALHLAVQAGQAWPRLVGRIVFLGTPHHGAPLERGGQRLQMLLSTSPYTEPFRRLGNVRSAGITDLRFGNLLDSDWKARDRFACPADERTPVPLPDWIEPYAIGGIVEGSADSVQARLIGDGLVPLESALCRHPDPRHRLAISAEHQWVALNTGHLELQTSPDIYKHLKRWLLPRAGQGDSRLR